MLEPVIDPADDIAAPSVLPDVADASDACEDNAADKFGSPVVSAAEADMAKMVKAAESSGNRVNFMILNLINCEYA